MTELVILIKNKCKLYEAWLISSKELYEFLDTLTPPEYESTKDSWYQG